MAVKVFGPKRLVWQMGRLQLIKEENHRKFGMSEKRRIFIENLIKKAIF